MPYDLTEPLVIGISSRALFNLEEENRIYENEGLAAYEEYQVKHESDILQKGSAFQLVKAFLQLNKLQEKRLVKLSLCLATAQTQVCVFLIPSKITNLILHGRHLLVDLRLLLI